MVMGAYTMLFAAFSPELKARNGKYITAWGRWMRPRDDLIREMEVGEDGNGYKLWEWCDKQAALYV
jgi:retinol dehydrogenase-12